MVPALLLSPLRLAHPVEDVGQLLGVFLQLLIAPLQFVVTALELAVLLVGGQLAFHRPQLQVVGLGHIGCAVERLRGLWRAVCEYLVEVAGAEHIQQGVLHRPAVARICRRRGIGHCRLTDALFLVPLLLPSGFAPKKALALFFLLPHLTQSGLIVTTNQLE